MAKFFKSEYIKETVQSFEYAELEGEI